MSVAEVREAYLAFFESHGHRRVGSASLVPSNDPTLLFTSAGMVQFKDLFTGREERPYRRATSSQRCLRAGGKHNDLDNVGFTPRHHTFFEMLGNFSFGDYFKAEAISWAWEFVTQVLKLPQHRLAVTVFAGEAGIPGDDEAAALWEETGVSRKRIFRLGANDNFWAMGDTGPCGPCSEIYFYLPGDKVDEGDRVGVSDAWIEIWNLVFMQFERKTPGGPLVALPRPSIDTGAGLERVASVVQGKSSNYDIDLFVPIFQTIERLSGRRYGASWNDVADSAMRVIADHARAAAFMISDGIQPSNEGRGYVLRRIMRRAIRHGSQHLNLQEIFFPRCVDAVVEAMGLEFPELEDRRSFLSEVALHEEEAFRRTLARGLQRIDEEMERARSSGAKLLTGESVWDLHQTYGFPADLTEVIARERGMEVDRLRFERLLDEERERAQGALGNREQQIQSAYLKLGSALPATEFIGYEATSGSGSIVAILRDGHRVTSAKRGDVVEIALDTTPFYAEGGGQVGDVGALLTSAGAEAAVNNCIKPTGGIFLHAAEVTRGEFRVGEEVSLRVDAERRSKIRANHSATHLLHRALKVVLGNGVNQKGSVVNDASLRFDFAHYAPMAPPEMAAVEDLVNGWIRDNAQTETRVMDLAEARKTKAVALFGEKYGERVRVVTVHPESVELCGGTHVTRTGDIGFFRVSHESAVAAGIRRIVASTGAAAVNHSRQQEGLLREAADQLRTTPEDLPRRIGALQQKAKAQERSLDEARASASGVEGEAECVRDANGVKVLTQLIEKADPDLLRRLADRHRDRLQSGVVGLGGTTPDGKALILVAATKDVVAAGFRAGDAVRALAPTIGGRGGGKAEMAQAGGSDPSQVPKALEMLVTLVAQRDSKG